MVELSVVEEQACTCTRCRLSETRTQVVFGVGHATADLLFVGEAPGREEDLKGEPFVGRSGRLLDKLVTEELGIDRSRFYIANVVKCRPPDNRNPKPDEIQACWPWLNQQLELIDPKVVVTLGNFSTKTVMKTTEGITKLRGKIYPYGHRFLVPTFHPSAALRTGATTLAMMREDLGLVRGLFEGAPAAALSSRAGS